ncbi:hypothetical protein [Vagococcus sp. CY52-2]|uniref:hypothetical protein n=1 Tax=Vagococcus sp. CY52-2 TaxID=2925838 RepID=UPI001F597F07|nr:hypothetical protein [Vagococcus sp. CY52-2]UNM90404.1 hypothetical protein MN187_04785 [Vagococcus sp. CY52-2]
MKNLKKYVLSTQESSIYEMIPHGLENAKRVKDISTPLKLDEREVHNAINSMCHKNIPICSSRKEPFGVYIPLNEEERRIGLVSLTNQVNNMSARVELVGRIDLNSWEETIETTYQAKLHDEY